MPSDACRVVSTELPSSELHCNGPGRIDCNRTQAADDQRALAGLNDCRAMATPADSQLVTLQDRRVSEDFPVRIEDGARMAHKWISRHRHRDADGRPNR